MTIEIIFGVGKYAPASLNWIRALLAELSLKFGENASVKETFQASGATHLLFEVGLQISNNQRLKDELRELEGIGGVMTALRHQ